MQKTAISGETICTYFVFFYELDKATLRLHKQTGNNCIVFQKLYDFFFRWDFFYEWYVFMIYTFVYKI